MGFFQFFLLLFSIIILIIKNSDQSNQPKRVCYLLVEKPEHLIPIDQLKFKLCSDWIFSFAHLNGYNVTISPLMDDYIRKVMSTTTNKTNVEQNFLISIGTGDMSFVDNPKDIEK